MLLGHLVIDAKSGHTSMSRQIDALEGLVFNKRVYFYKGVIKLKMLGGSDSEINLVNVADNSTQFNDISFKFEDDTIPAHLPESSNRYFNWKSISGSEWNKPVHTADSLISGFQLVETRHTVSLPNYFNNSRVPVQLRINLAGNDLTDPRPKLIHKFKHRLNRNTISSGNYTVRHSVYAKFDGPRYQARIIKVPKTELLMEEFAEHVPLRFMPIFTN